MDTNLSEILVPVLEGQHNFRDLGGIPTKDGRIIKSGLLFRSGDLHSITDEDVRMLEEIGLEMIIDFRSPREYGHRPNRKIPGVKEIKHIPIYDAPREFAAHYIEENNEEGLKHLLTAEYSRIILTYSAEYSHFLYEVAHNPHIPLVYQCSAGKDRTGLASIFLLTALGVDLEDSLKDYFRTNLFARVHAHEIIGILNSNGHNGELMRPMLEVREEYIDAAFNTIYNRFGNLENFVFNELGAETKLLRERFLE